MADSIKKRFILPIEDTHRCSVLYAITRLTQMDDGQWMVTSPDVYIGTTYNCVPTFHQRLRKENFEVKIRGSDGLYMISLLRKNAAVVRSLEALYLDLFFNKGLKVLGHLNIINIVPGFMPSKTIKSWPEPNDTSHQTILKVLKDTFDYGIQNGKKISATSIF